MATTSTQETKAAGHGGGSMLTVLIALAANALIAVAKTAAALLTGSASMVAESAHSWADTGNEALLLVAERKAAKEPDTTHPLGYGRAAYVWSMIAAFGLFTAGSILSVMHGVSALRDEGPGEDYLVAYVVLAVAFVLEGVSFVQAVRQTRAGAAQLAMRPLRFVLDTSQTTLRAVFFEDAAALVGILLAGGGLVLHQVSGEAVWDAVGSILVGVLLGLVAILLIVRNGQFLIGQVVAPFTRRRVLSALLDDPEIEQVTFAHMEYVGPSRIFVIAAVDLVADDRESVLRGRLQTVEDRLHEDPLIARAVLSLSAPDEGPLRMDD